MEQYHRPVLLNEVVEQLDLKPGKKIIDCTLGGAGHTKAILSRILPSGIVIGIDQDSDAIDQASRVLVGFEENIRLVQGNFYDLKQILRNLSIDSVDGILFDLGVSSHQLDVAERGFSFASDAPLDMRMDRNQPVTAASLVNELSERELSDIIYTHSDERWAKRIARVIVERREIKPIESTSELAAIVSKAIPAKGKPEKIHPATRTFQALRIAVNSELKALEDGLEAAADALAVGGRLCVISYHSLEDRIVKQFFATASGRCQCPPGLPICACGAKQYLKVLTRKPVLPTDEEIESNPRARSAKLRVAEKVVTE